jgi:hypothetical protein
MTSDERNDPAREYMARKKAEMDGKNVEQENQEAIARAERKAGQTQGQTAAQNLEREFSQMRNAEKGMTPRERMEQHHNRAGVRLEEKDYQNLKSFMDVFKQQNPDERTLIRLVYGPMKYGPRFTMPEFGAPQSAKAPGDDTQYATKTPIDDMLNRWGTAVQVDPQIIQAYSDYAALQIPGLKDQLTPDKWLNQRWQLFDARTNEPVEIEIGDGWYPVKSYQIENLEQGWKPKDDRLESLTFAHDILSEVAPQLDPNGQYVVRVVGSEDEGRTDFVQQDDVTQPAYTMSVHENQANQAEADQDLTENDRPLSPDETRDHIQELDQFKDSIKIPGNEIEGSQMPDIMGLLRNKGQKGIDRNIDPTEYFEYADVKNDQYPKMIGKPYYTPDGTWELVPLPKPRFGMYEWVKGPSRGRGLPPTWTLKPTYEDKSGWADPEYEDAYDIKTKWKSNKTPASKGMSTRFNPYEGRHVLEQDEAPVRGQESLNALSEKKESKKKGAEEKAKQPEVAPVRGKKDDFTPKTPKDIKAEKEKRKKSMKERAGKHVESEQEKYAPVRGAR